MYRLVAEDDVQMVGVAAELCSRPRHCSFLNHDRYPSSRSSRNEHEKVANHESMGRAHKKLPFFVFPAGVCLVAPDVGWSLGTRAHVGHS